MARAMSRKKPCSICGKWFLPDNRKGKAHRTCNPECSRELHRRQCEKRNNRNKPESKTNYLSKKLRTATIQSVGDQSPIVLPSSRLNLNLPRKLIQEKIGTNNLIIIEYVIEQFSRRPLLLPYQSEKEIDFQDVLTP